MTLARTSVGRKIVTCQVYLSTWAGQTRNASPFAPRGRCHNGPVVAEDAPQRVTPPTSGSAPEAGGTPVAYVRPSYVAWADLLRRVFAFDILACPDCGGRLRLLATIAPRYGLWPTRGGRRTAEPNVPSRPRSGRIEGEDPDPPRVARRSAAALGSAHARVAPGRARWSRCYSAKRCEARVTKTTPVVLLCEALRSTSGQWAD